MTDPQSIRILSVDDRPLLREGIACRHWLVLRLSLDVPATQR
jgi:hypothetical protein